MHTTRRSTHASKINHDRCLGIAAIGASMFLISGTANADAGVPMLFLTLPAMAIALIPIIVIESIVVGRILGTSAASKAKSVAIANVASTVIGLPLTWIALVIIQLVSGGGSAYGLTTPTQKFLAVTWQAPWLIPYEGDLYWMIPAASLFLLVPFFFASYFIESPIVVHMNEKLPHTQVRQAVLRANIISYLILALFDVGWLIFSVLHDQRSS